MPEVTMREKGRGDDRGGERGGDRGGDRGGGRGGDPGGDRGMGKVDEVLGGLLRSLGIHHEVARQEVLERWPEVVGERIAAVTRARSVARGILFVDVRSSAWITELNLMRHELLTRLNAGAGEGRVERIVFSQAEDAGAGFGHAPGREPGHAPGRASGPGPGDAPGRESGREPDPESGRGSGREPGKDPG
jgi:hypothetical protein